MSGEFESTLEIAAHAKNGGMPDRYESIEDLSNSRVAIQSGNNSSQDISLRFQEATRKLLRQRLIAASFTLASLILVVFALVLVFDQPTTRQTIFRTVSLIATFSIYTVLRRFESASSSFLRLMEIMLLVIPMTEASLDLVFESQRLLAAGKFGEIATLHAIMGTAVAVFITVYGIFIPAKWYRTAIITGCMALLPTVIAAFHVASVPDLASAGIPNYATTALLLMIAGVATIGSRIVNTTRKQVESARQFGQYQLKEQIGQGGMGVVYRAEHRMLKRPAAIKLIRSESAFNEDAIQRFESEVQLSATLSHWNTVQIYDYGRTSNGDFYYVMEHLNGESLKQRIKNVGQLTQEATTKIIHQLCDGLAEAHQRGMVHRDLKPANIFLAETAGQNDIVKILDFGLAVETTNTSYKNQGLCGSPPYMSPEQILASPVDNRSDIYAIGCIIYECLTGNLLFDGNNVEEIIQKHLTTNPNLSQVEEGTSRIRTAIERCTKKDSTCRFASVRDLKEFLQD